MLTLKTGDGYLPNLGITVRNVIKFEVQMFIQGLKLSIRCYKNWEEIKKEEILYTIIGR